MSDRDSLPGADEVLAGRYRIVRQLGEGGMGVVFEAEHIRLRQPVAVKMLLPSLCERPDVVARFEREARAAIQLTSDHVARVTDVDVRKDGTPFLVMELLVGHDLAAELEKRGPLPVQEAVGFVLEACDAMIEAHAMGIVHRDLKPANLFLAESFGRRTLKVLDFGISKVTTGVDEPALTSTFAALGTVLYMSPEQVRSAKRVDARSDVWALGVILYELLTGGTPFNGDSATGVAAAIVADPVPSLGALRPKLPDGLEAVVMRALEKDREQRYPDVASLAAALAPYATEAARASLRLPDPASAPQRSASELAQTSVAVSAPGAQSPPTAPGWSTLTAPRRERKTVVIAAASGAVVALALVGIFFATRSHDATEVPSASPPVAAEQGPSVEPVESADTAASGAPSASASAASAPPASASAAPRPTPHTTTRQKHISHVAAPKPTPKPVPKRKPKPSGGIGANGIFN